MSSADWEKAFAERDGRIAELEQQVADAAKNAEAADQLCNGIAELKARDKSDRIDFKLQLTGGAQRKNGTRDSGRSWRRR